MNLRIHSLRYVCTSVFLHMFCFIFLLFLTFVALVQFLALFILIRCYFLLLCLAPHIMVCCLFIMACMRPIAYFLFNFYHVLHHCCRFWLFAHFISCICFWLEGPLSFWANFNILCFENFMYMFCVRVLTTPRGEVLLPWSGACVVEYAL